MATWCLKQDCPCTKYCECTDEGVCDWCLARFDGEPEPAVPEVVEAIVAMNRSLPQLYPHAVRITLGAETNGELKRRLSEIKSRVRSATSAEVIVSALIESWRIIIEHGDGRIEAVDTRCDVQRGIS